MNKRILALMLVLVMVLSVFTACRKQNEEAETTVGTTETIVPTETLMPGVVENIFELEENNENSVTEAIETEEKHTENDPEDETIPGDLIEDNTEKKEENPKETTPKETTPKETTPKETTPKETTPKETTPKESTPKETTPKESTPKETTPKQTEPDQSKDMTAYEAYKAMSPDEQMAFYESFGSAEAFLEWFNNAKAEYEAKQTIVEIGEGGAVVEIIE